MDEREIWEDFYKKQPRAWRGSAEVPDLGLPPGSVVLDAGCGNGKTSSNLLKRGYNVIGIDFSRNAIDSCSSYYGDTAEFFTEDCLDMSFSDSSFDGIFAVHLTEHFDDDSVRTFSSESMRILKPRGRLFVRSFSPDDMRSDKTVRNGIRYHHRTPDGIASLFSGFDVLSSELVNEKTKFGTFRSRSECIFSKPL